MPLTRGQRSTIDNSDVVLVAGISWQATPNRLGGYYAKSSMGLLHRIVINAPPEYEVDHINHDTLDNRRINLRLVTHKGNMENGKYALTLICPAGHFYDARNALIDNKDSRYCRACKLVSRRKSYWKNRESILARQKPKRPAMWAAWHAKNREQLLPKKRAYEARRRAEKKATRENGK